MRTSGPRVTRKLTRLEVDGRRYSLILEKSGWRLRCRAKSRPVDFRTQTNDLATARTKAREWLENPANLVQVSRRGGGDLETLAKLYLATPKRTKQEVAEINISRLRTVCRKAIGRELQHVTCKEVGPAFWARYQGEALKAAGRAFSLVTRYRENIGINSAVRAARCLFLPALLRAYRAAGLEVNDDAGAAVMLPEPYVPPSAVDDRELIRGWRILRRDDRRLWLVIGLARFAGLRRDEIQNCRVGWLENFEGSLVVRMRDRPEENWWTKTGKPYPAQVIGRRFTRDLRSHCKGQPPDAFVVPDPPDGGDRSRWFEREPQRWLQRQGIKAQKPLHRLRGLYADHIAKIAGSLLARRAAGMRAAQSNLGHTTSATTERYVSR